MVVDSVNQSPIEWLGRFGPDEMRQWLDSVEATYGPRALELALHEWRVWARPKQLMPLGNWSVLVWMAGRGFGKTRCLAEFAHDRAEKLPGSQGALVARTAADTRGTLVEGKAGILKFQKPWNPCTYNLSKREVTWANGTKAMLYSSEEPDQLRGANNHWAVCDEYATWKKVKAADGGTAWDHVRLSTRLEYGREIPRVGVGTTPRPTREMKMLLAEQGVVVIQGHQTENASNLSAEYLRLMEAKYGGTRMGRQELAGQLLEDVDGAIINLSVIDDARLDALPTHEDGSVVTLDRVAVGVDPSGGRDEQGIVAAARAEKCPCNNPMSRAKQPHYFILDDRSGNYTPEGWSAAAVRLYYATQADRIIGERNCGGDMVKATVRNADSSVPFTEVLATRGKAVRAEPILALYEQRRIHHIGMFPALEDELCRFTALEWMGAGSPNRADAAVWAITHLMAGSRREFRVWQ